VAFFLGGFFLGGFFPSAGVFRSFLNRGVCNLYASHNFFNRFR